MNRLFCMRIKTIFIFIFAIYFHVSSAQVLVDSISSWSLTLIKDTVAVHRVEALRKLESTLDKELVANKNLNIVAGEIEGVSKVKSEDGRIGLISFVIYRNENDYGYLGYIIDYSSKTAQKLIDKSVNQISDDEVFNLRKPDNWWGAIYYDIHKLDKDVYLLFGYDSYSLFEQMKIIDVLDLSGGQITFGKPVFGKEGQSHRMRTNRFFYRYSAMTSAKLNYDQDLQMIVMDHLEEIKSPYKDIGMMSVPDGTMSGYRIEDGMCNYVDRVDIAIDQSVPVSSESKIKRKEIYKRGRKNN